MKIIERTMFAYRFSINADGQKSNAFETVSADKKDFKYEFTYNDAPAKIEFTVHGDQYGWANNDFYVTDDYLTYSPRRGDEQIEIECTNLNTIQ